MRKIYSQLEKLDPLFKSKYLLYILICIVLDLLSKHLALNYFPNGFINSIKEGSKVRTETIANNIAKPVKIPK